MSAVDLRVLHPRSGPHAPARGTPPRRPDSVRRTTTHDSLRPDGLSGEVRVVAYGRDLRTRADGDAEPIATARIEARVDYLDWRRVLEIGSDPPESALSGLAGVSAASGFRRAVDAVLPGERTANPLRYQLLDDFPTALLVAGYALAAGDHLRMVTDREAMLPQVDLCAGWTRSGTILTEMEERGVPPLNTGPEAPSLLSPDDPAAWHELAPLGPHALRRWRRIDVWSEGEGYRVDSFFRDAHVDVQGRETVIHEYGVEARVDADAGRFLSCDVRIGTLPWRECTGATASAGRLVGAPVDGLRAWVRQTFVGPPTCTHLNDTLRALEDVPALLGALRG